MKLLIFLPLLSIAVLVAADAGAADRPEYSLKLDVEKKEVQLGQDMVLTITLSKRRGKAVDVNALRLARNSVSLRVKIGEREHTVTRIYGHEIKTPEGPRRIVDDRAPKKELKKGKPLVLELPLLATTTGKLSVTAVYTGLAKGPAVLNSEPVAVTVTAPEGKNEIAAIMETSEGTMVLTFVTEKTFNTVLNFLTLAKEGRYDGLTFHRIMKGFMAQGGDPKGSGSGGPGFSIPREIDPSIRHVRGVISMARTKAPDSAGSQFFLMFKPDASLDGKFAAFGTVVEGDEVLGNLAKVRTDPASRQRSRPIKPPVIKTIRLTTR